MGRTLAAARRRLTLTAGRNTTMRLQPWATAPRVVATSGSSRTAGAQAGERVASSGSRGALAIADLASITMLHRTAPWVDKSHFQYPNIGPINNHHSLFVNLCNQQTSRVK